MDIVSNPKDSLRNSIGDERHNSGTLGLKRLNRNTSGSNSLDTDVTKLKRHGIDSAVACEMLLLSCRTWEIYYGQLLQYYLQYSLDTLSNTEPLQRL